MEPIEFLKSVVPHNGTHFAVEKSASDRYPKQRSGDLNFVANFCAQASAGGRDAYFALGGFSGATKNQYGFPKRVAIDATLQRSLRLDIDTGEGKPYPDKRSALLALLQFCNTLSLPKPWIIDSGGGLHVYWAIDKDTELADWAHASERLKAACMQHDLHADHTVTTDAARILRMPGTFNYKRQTPEPVRILQVGTPSPLNDIVQHFPDAAPPKPLNPTATPPFKLRGVLTQCPEMANALRTGGVGIHEPLWKRQLDLINASDESEDVKYRVALAISNKHEGFGVEGFEDKWEMTRSQGYGAPSCDGMAKAGAKACATCPFNGRIKFPSALGRIVSVPVTPTPTTPALPLADQPSPPAASAAGGVVLAPTQSGVFTFADGSRVQVNDGELQSNACIRRGIPTVVVRTKNEDGTFDIEHRTVLPYKIVAVDRGYDKVDSKSVTTLWFDAGMDGEVKLVLSGAEKADPKKLAEKMANSNLFVSVSQAKQFLEAFMQPFLRTLQAARAANEVAVRCGWSADHNSFALGSYVYRRDGSVDTAFGTSVPEELEGYRVQGDEVSWREAFDVCMNSGPDRQAVLALSLAGPLMEFSGLHGAMLNAYSPESGVGKSTLCDAALSIWGSPDTLRKDFRDTSVATFKLAAITGNMPMVVDEFTNIEGKVLSDYVYTLTQGREKHRLDSSANLRSGGKRRWKLVAITTANNSIHDKLLSYRPDANAEAMRVFELRLKPLSIPPAEMSAAKAKLSNLSTSYGHLGPRVVRVFMSKPAEYWEKLVLEKIAKWDAAVGNSTGDRFRSAICALIECGTEVGKELGIVFDAAGISNTLRTQWGVQVSQFVENKKTPHDFLVEYWAANVTSFASHAEGSDTCLLPTGGKSVMGEKFYKGSKLTHFYIPTSHISTFLAQRNGSARLFNEWAKGLYASDGFSGIRKVNYMAGPNAVTLECFVGKGELVGAEG